MHSPHLSPTISQGLTSGHATHPSGLSHSYDVACAFPLVNALDQLFLGICGGHGTQLRRPLEAAAGFRVA